MLKNNTERKLLSRKLSPGTWGKEALNNLHAYRFMSGSWKEPWESESDLWAVPTLGRRRSFQTRAVSSLGFCTHNVEITARTRVRKLNGSWEGLKEMIRAAFSYPILVTLLTEPSGRQTATIELDAALLSRGAHISVYGPQPLAKWQYSRKKSGDYQIIRS